jgi:hypothetical protein|tara:strand:- start:163 stop:534 length:372 start_codon:yes stop_codon:yes gene_type:complete
LESNKQVNVYVTNYTENYDIRPALDHVRGGGKLLPVTRGKINIFQTEELVRKIDTVVMQMDKDDWVLISGNTVVSSLVVAKVYDVFGHINLLLWDSREKSYAPRIVTLDCDMPSLIEHNSGVS